MSSTSRPLAARTALAACVLALLLAACGGDDDAGDAERFCGEIAENADVLIRPDLTGAGDPNAAIDALLEEYRRIGQYAPLAVEAEWDQLVEAYESAAAVDAQDPLSEQEALEAIFRAEGAAVAVAAWLRANCAVEIGPLATIVGEGVTTTVDPATTEP